MYSTCLHPSVIILESSYLSLSLFPPGEEGEERGEGYGSEGYQGPCLKGPQLWLTQALALAVKRGLYTYRRSLAYTVQTVLPLLLIVLGLGISNQLQVYTNVHEHKCTSTMPFCYNGCEISVTCMRVFRIM